jgi:uncharacterized protein involved in propanediol utilization
MTPGDLPVRRLRRTQVSLTLKFAELFQGIVRENGDLQVGIIANPCPAFKATADFVPNESGSITVFPAWCKYSQAAADVLSEIYDLEGVGAEVRVLNNAPVCGGAARSTGDIYAASMAIAAGVGLDVTRDLLEGVAFAAERASDPLLLVDEPARLYASRSGHTIEHYSRPLPELVVLGVRSSCTPVDTKAYDLPQYSYQDLAKFDVLRVLARRAIETSDPALMAQVSTESALVNQQFLPQENFAELLKFVNGGVALGVAVAHTGRLMGLLLDPRSSEIDELEQRLNARFGPVWRFTNRATNKLNSTEECPCL